MRKTRIAVLTVGIVAVLALTLTLMPLRAQEEMAPVACDSTLISLVYLAEYHYGYHPAIAMGDTMIEFDHGQFTPWFEAMMAMMESGEMEAKDTSEMEEMMMDESMMEGMTILKPGHIEGEDTYCTDLRNDVDAFLYSAISAEMMAMESGS